MKGLMAIADWRTKQEKRERNYINDDLAVWDRFFGFASPTFSLLRGEFYDPEKYELTPRKGFQEQQLKFKEKKLEELKDRRKNDNLLYDEQEKELKLEIDTLKQKIGK
jgi:hypothetical protein